MNTKSRGRGETESTVGSNNLSHKRGVKSYVLRAGRLTTGQQRALRDLWPLYGITRPARALHPAEFFAQAAPVNMEIGFGNGDNLVAMAVAAPDENFLGVEVHEPGVGHCLLKIEEAGATNVRLIRHDAIEVLRDWLVDHSLARVNLFFPDPWHKKRHHKRRIVQPEFARLLARKLQPGGMLHIVTDWPDYAEHIAAILAQNPDFETLDKTPGDRITTRFDTRGKRLGHSNWERAWCTRSKLPIPT